MPQNSPLRLCKILYFIIFLLIYKHFSRVCVLSFWISLLLTLVHLEINIVPPYPSLKCTKFILHSIGYSIKIALKQVWGFEAHNYILIQREVTSKIIYGCCNGSIYKCSNIPISGWKNCEVWWNNEIFFLLHLII